MTDKIKEALAKLSPSNANHWTADGSPRIETLRMLTGTPGLTRDEVIAADANFNRDVAQKNADAAKEKETQADGQRELGQLAMAQNVDATGKVNTNPSQGMPPPDGAPSDAPAPGSIVAPDGATANPNAESDNQRGTGEVDLDALQDAQASDEQKLKDQIQAGESYLNELISDRDGLNTQISTVQQQLDTLKSKLPSTEPGHRETMATIQAFLRSQQDKRDRRAEQAMQDDAGRSKVRRADKEPVDQALEARRRDAHGAVKTVQQTSQ